MSLEHIEVCLVIFLETSETGHVAFPENWLIWHGMTRSSSSTESVSECSDSDGDTETARIGPRPLADPTRQADAGN